MSAPSSATDKQKGRGEPVPAARPPSVACPRAGRSAGAGTRSSASRGSRNWSGGGCPAARNGCCARGGSGSARGRRSCAAGGAGRSSCVSSPPRWPCRLWSSPSLGFFLTQQIADGLLLNNEKLATAQVSQGLTVAESSPDLNRAPVAAVADSFLYPTAQELQNANGDNSTYDVVVIEVSQDRVASPVYTRGVSGAPIPRAFPPPWRPACRRSRTTAGPARCTTRRR